MTSFLGWWHIISVSAKTGGPIKWMGPIVKSMDCGENRTFLHLRWTNSLRSETGLVRVCLPLPGESHFYRDRVTHSRVAYCAGAGSKAISIGNAVTRNSCRFELPRGVHRCSSGRLFATNEKAKHCHILILDRVLIVN